MWISLPNEKKKKNNNERPEGGLSPPLQAERPFRASTNLPLPVLLPEAVRPVSGGGAPAMGPGGITCCYPPLGFRNPTWAPSGCRARGKFRSAPNTAKSEVAPLGWRSRGGLIRLPRARPSLGHRNGPACGSPSLMKKKNYRTASRRGFRHPSRPNAPLELPRTFHCQCSSQRLPGL